MESIKRLFRVFDEGAFFKWIIVVLFALGALLTLLNAAALDFRLLKLLKHSSFFNGVGWIVLSGGVLLACLAQIAILLFRGSYEISRVRQPRYSILALIAKSIRAVSESYLLLFGILAPFACLATWFGGLEVLPKVPYPIFSAAIFFITENVFLSGLLVFVYGIVLALAQLVAAYCVAELIDLMPAIAGDVAAIRQSKNSVKTRGAS
ncbi:MAG: hypothetical protein JXO72_13845 [Vicinamibacteria bacterium]|nr:hypothetical protein [Vicinamibacteria bacterium]